MIAEGVSRYCSDPPSIFLVPDTMAAAGREGGFMVPELRRERERSALNLPELTHFIDGGEFVSKKRRKLCECIL